MSQPSRLADHGAIESFLHDHGAGNISHPGGNLLDHLRRVASLLDEWGASRALWSAGYCHAAYGTDGFDVNLIDPSQRALLEAVIGPGAEGLVYIYASCDRSAVYPGLDGSAAVHFRDRLSGDTSALSGVVLRSFLELTAANELDVLAHNDAMAAEHGPSLARLFQRVRPLLSPGAVRAIDAQLGLVANE